MTATVSPSSRRYVSTLRCTLPLTKRCDCASYSTSSRFAAVYVAISSVLTSDTRSPSAVPSLSATLASTVISLVLISASGECPPKGQPYDTTSSGDPLAPPVVTMIRPVAESISRRTRGAMAAGGAAGAGSSTGGGVAAVNVAPETPAAIVVCSPSGGGSASTERRTAGSPKIAYPRDSAPAIHFLASGMSCTSLPKTAICLTSCARSAPS